MDSHKKKWKCHCQGEGQGIVKYVFTDAKGINHFDCSLCDRTFVDVHDGERTPGRVWQSKFIMGRDEYLKMVWNEQRMIQDSIRSIKKDLEDPF